MTGHHKWPPPSTTQMIGRIYRIMLGLVAIVGVLLSAASLIILIRVIFI